jgi:hypothetical protein
MNPAIEVAGNVGDGFARAERGGGLGMIEEDHAAAHALDADVERDTSAERRLFKDEGDEFAGESGSVTARTSLHIGGEKEEVARMRGAPLGSGEQIIR